ncbi:MAG: phosphodiester glycosidase family protein [Candidatus Symbiothrix sp.]|jgi:exopolysaccharide biosynthesis protein|nr:phosphodiester glycosidase family protein [Candidatus Symbiothrix sp.]
MNFTVKKISLVLVCLILSLQTFAQSSVSEVSQVIVQTDWTTKQITEKIVFKQAQINIFDSKQSISILTILPDSTTQLAINDVSDTLIVTSELCKQVDAIAGVNASFFDMKNGGAIDFVRVNGTILHKTRKISERSNAAFAIYKRGVQILERDTIDANWEHTIDCKNVIVAGPLIMKNGEAVKFSKDAFNKNRHPRTCIATKTDGRVLLIVVDGRNANAAGMSLNELYVLAKSLDCADAMNLDGGGSSTMYVRGEDTNGVVNYPSDNQQFDHEGERRVANVIYVCNK